MLILKRILATIGVLLVSLATTLLTSSHLQAAEASATANSATDFALNQQGKGYAWGGKGPDRYDCSGLVYAAYKHAGVTLPRMAADQYKSTTKIGTNQLTRGDLLFYGTPGNAGSIYHVAIYVGDGRIVHAPKSGDVVKAVPIFWQGFFGASRVK